MMSTPAARSSEPVPSAQPVPMCDILGQYLALKPEIDAAVLRVLESGQVILGPEVAAFEREYADFCGTGHAVGCADGTTALLLALAALDIGPGDEVIVPPFTFFATVGSVIRCGATPVFADIDSLTYNLDPDEIERKITSRTRAIMPVHLFGQCADVDAIQGIAERHGLYVVEDAAQAFGAEYHGRRAGSFGQIGCFSFYPSKNVGTLGDAGLVTTDDDRLAKKLVALRNHGSEQKYFHKYVGWNARIDAIHAAILRVKLPHVSGWLLGRREAAGRYDEKFETAGLSGFVHRPVAVPGHRHTYNQYVVRIAAQHRDGLIKHLRADGIGCDIYYPRTLHEQECLSSLGHTVGDFPVSEVAAASVLALPMFPELSEAQQDRVVASVAGYAGGQVRMAG